MGCGPISIVRYRDNPGPKEASILGNKTLTVLLIEDNHDHANLVLQWLSVGLQDMRFVVDRADTLASGLSRLAQGGVDAILLDLGLQASDGLATFVAVRAHALAVPIIVLSGAESQFSAYLIPDGPQDYLVKRNCTAELLTGALRDATSEAQLCG